MNIRFIHIRWDSDTNTYFSHQDLITEISVIVDYTLPLRCDCIKMNDYIAIRQYILYSSLGLLIPPLSELYSASINSILQIVPDEVKSVTERGVTLIELDRIISSWRLKYSLDNRSLEMFGDIIEHI